MKYVVVVEADTLGEAQDAQAILNKAGICTMIAPYEEETTPKKRVKKAAKAPEKTAQEKAWATRKAKKLATPEPAPEQAAD